jgi:cyclic pyranopterin phosphate synthase
MPSEGIEKLGHSDILTYEEILRVARIAVGLGIEKIRLTGGEPFLRKGFLEFVPALTAIPGLRDVSLSTNGIYLRQTAETIRAAGIQRINVSLDSLRRERYARITSSDAFDDVFEGIELARELGFNPIKINVVVLQGVNDDEVVDFAGLTLSHPYHVRFIEYMPVGFSDPRETLHHVPNSEIKLRLSQHLGRLFPVKRGPLDGPSERFRLKGAKGEIGFISPLTHHFCGTCNRLRLTANGHLRPCLLIDREKDLKGPMRKGVSDRELDEIFLGVAASKPYAHPSAQDKKDPFPANMSAIGG